MPPAVQRVRCEVLRADRIAAAEALAYRKLPVGAALLALAMGISVVHWRCIGAFARAPQAPRAP